MMPNFQGSKAFANGWFYEREGEWYANICKNIFNGNILEIGSFEGLSLFYIKNTIKTNNNKIYSVEENCRKKLIENTDLWGINLLCKSSEKASKEFPKNFFDFIYIDGDHSYKSVKQDISLWIGKLKKNGIMAGHDYNWPGVKQAVDEKFKNKFKLFGRNWIVNNKSFGE
jgi:predicted O-methyltransferase YrrM